MCLQLVRTLAPKWLRPIMAKLWCQVGPCRLKPTKMKPCVGLGDSPWWQLVKQAWGSWWQLVTAGETSLVKQACFGLELGRGFNLGSSRFCASGLASCQPGPSWGNSCAKLGGALQRWGKAWKPRRETQPPLNREARSWLKHDKLGDYFLQPLKRGGNRFLIFSIWWNLQPFWKESTSPPASWRKSFESCNGF